MQTGSDETLYVFEYDTETEEYGYTGQTVSIEGAPADADLSSFAVLHDDGIARLYARSSTTNSLHQFGFDAGSAGFVYGHESIDQLDIVDTPGGTDWSGWAMLHDGDDFRLYAFSSAARQAVVQHAYDADVEDYVHGFASLSPVDLQAIPVNSDTADFAMLHDGEHYRLYFLTTD
jgi:hypothetical protein